MSDDELNVLKVNGSSYLLLQISLTTVTSVIS